MRVPVASVTSDEMTIDSAVSNESESQGSQHNGPTGSITQELIQQGVPDPSHQATQTSITPPVENNGPIQPSEISDEDIVIAIMGVTGSGKSTFISLLTGGGAAVGHSLESCTSEVGVYSYLHDGNQKVHLIDTPGFDDTNRSDTDVLKDIAFFLTTIYTSRIRLAGLIYLHRIIDVRMQGSALKNVHMFKELCGEDSLSNVVLVTTMWNVLGQSGLSSEVGIDRENQLIHNDKFWGYMEKKGSRVVRHSGDAESARSIVSILVNKKEKVVLDIQRQMVDEKQTLDETAAGKFVQKELIEARKRYERDLSDFQQSMEDALKENDERAIASITEQKQEYETKIARAISSERGLKISLEKLAEEKDQQHAALVEDLEREKAARHQQLETKASEIQLFEQNLRHLQDTLDRKDKEHHREMARIRHEQATKSAEEAGRLESFVLNRELHWAKQQMELQSQITHERQIREMKERELDNARHPNEGNNILYFLKHLFESAAAPAHSTRNGGRGSHSRDNYR